MDLAQSRRRSEARWQIWLGIVMGGCRESGFRAQESRGITGQSLTQEVRTLNIWPDTRGPPDWTQEARRHVDCTARRAAKPMALLTPSNVFH